MLTRTLTLTLTLTLTPNQVLKQCVDCLSFGKFGGKFDIKISGLGLDLLVSQARYLVITPTIATGCSPSASTCSSRRHPDPNPSPNPNFNPNPHLLVSQVANTLLKEPRVGEISHPNPNPNP